jgi:hypothetical protein
MLYSSNYIRVLVTSASTYFVLLISKLFEISKKPLKLSLNYFDLVYLVFLCIREYVFGLSITHAQRIMNDAACILNTQLEAVSMKFSLLTIEHC